MKKTDTPFFSIGITTYNRKEMLKETLNSILKQSFKDFEVIIGNDYVQEPLLLSQLGINDSRVRILNHPINMGELGNMNSIFQNSKGRYFTWQFDDDPCDLNLLFMVFDALKKTNFPKCAFTGYKTYYGDGPIPTSSFCSQLTNKPSVFSGLEFISKYWSGKINLMGCCGFFSNNYLSEIGGAPKVSEGKIALYSEYMIINKVGLLNKVLYIESPLIISRAHSSSWSVYNQQFDLYKEAGLNLLRESIPIFQNQKLVAEFESNVRALITFIISAFVMKSIQAGKYFNLNTDLKSYIKLIDQILFDICSPGLYEKAQIILKKVESRIYLLKIRALLKVLIPINFFSFLKRLENLVRQF
jgi:glycosyltransferase involved in cell wall biosynthesis